MATKSKYPKGQVFAVSKSGTLTGYHTVHYSTTGNLNKGQTKNFRKWTLAKKFANDKAKEWGIKATFSTD